MKAWSCWHYAVLDILGCLNTTFNPWQSYQSWLLSQKSHDTILPLILLKLRKQPKSKKAKDAPWESCRKSCSNLREASLWISACVFGRSFDWFSLLDQETAFGELALWARIPDCTASRALWRVIAGIEFIWPLLDVKALGLLSWGLLFWRMFAWPSERLTRGDGFSMLESDGISDELLVSTLTPLTAFSWPRWLLVWSGCKAKDSAGWLCKGAALRSSSRPEILALLSECTASIEGLSCVTSRLNLLLTDCSCAVRGRKGWSLLCSLTLEGDIWSSSSPMTLKSCRLDLLSVSSVPVPESFSSFRVLSLRDLLGSWTDTSGLAILLEPFVRTSEKLATPPRCWLLRWLKLRSSPVCLGRFWLFLNCCSLRRDTRCSISCNVCGLAEGWVSSWRSTSSKRRPPPVWPWIALCQKEQGSV